MHALPDDWKKLSGDARNKNLIFQARMTWTAAEVAKRRPELREEYLRHARHGLAFLKDKMWDAQDGGFFWIVDERGNPTSMTDKHIYGNGFGIYAAATVYQATKDPAALELAMNAFKWIEQHQHDAKNGGYYEVTDRAGNVILSAEKSRDPNNPNDFLGYPYGRKSMNSHIHILEALTVLAQVTPDPLVKQRLDEVFLIVRDKIAAEPGYLHYLLTPTWQPASTQDSYGHDIETAYLLWEAALVRSAKPDERTRAVTRSLVDHPLAVAWDQQYGAFFYEGPVGGKPENLAKSWWAEAEALNALLLMHELYGKQSPKYWDYFTKQWAFIRDHQIDPKDGGWYNEVGRDGTVKKADKIQPWKASYHSGRAMMNASDALQKLAAE